MRGRGDSELVRVVTLHSWSCGWLLPRLSSFAAVHPGIRLSIETGFALSRFEEGGPDLGIRHGGGHWPGLTAHLLMHENLFPVASPSMAGFDSIRSPADIARMPLIGDAGRQGWHDWFRAAKVRGATPDERYRFSDSNAALNAAALGLGIALAREQDRGTLAAIATAGAIARACLACPLGVLPHPSRASPAARCRPALRRLAA